MMATYRAWSLTVSEELDRLRRQLAGAAHTEPSELGDGFAPTQPMRDGM